MGLISNLRYITSHPLNKDDKIKALTRWAAWQVKSRTNKSYQLYKWIGGIKVLTKSGDRGFTGNIYTILQDYEEMSLLIDFIQEGELFVDVGANIGAYSLLAAKLCNAKVISFEPISESYNSLKKNIEVNNLEKLIDARKVCLSDKPGELIMSCNKNTQNSVIEGETKHVAHEAVKASTLDKEISAQNPRFIKIDVEGFENNVLKGGEKLFSSRLLEVVIIETCRNEIEDASSYSIKEKLLGYNFKLVGYDPLMRKFRSPSEHEAGKNSIFVRNPEKIEHRLASSRVRKALGL